MTPLERLKELNEKATPGPWTVHREHEGWWWVKAPDVQRAFDDGSACGEYNQKCDEETRDLITATRNLLPELLALWEAVDEYFWKDAAYPGASTQALFDALDTLNARADEVLK